MICLAKQNFPANLPEFRRLAFPNPSLKYTCLLSPGRKHNANQDTREASFAMAANGEDKLSSLLAGKLLVQFRRKFLFPNFWDASLLPSYCLWLLDSGMGCFYFSATLALTCLHCRSQICRRVLLLSECGTSEVPKDLSLWCRSLQGYFSILQELLWLLAWGGWKRCPCACFRSKWLTTAAGSSIKWPELPSKLSSSHWFLEMERMNGQVIFRKQVFAIKPA